MLYTAFLFVIFFVAFRFVPKLQLNGMNRWMMPAAYALKVAVGFYFLYIYTAVYGNGSLSADAGAFMEESAILNNVFFTSPSDYFQLLTGLGDQSSLVAKYLSETSHWDSGAQAIISDNRNVMRVNSVIHFVSNGNTAIHILFMCALSLFGLKQLFLGLKKHVQLSDPLLFLLLLLFPSVLFWTSSILKEPLMLIGIGLFVRGILGKELPLKKWSFIILGALFLLAFKPYVLFCLIPAILFYAIYSILPKFNVFLASASLLLLVSAPAFLFPNQRQKVVHLLSRKQYDFKNVGKGGLHAESDSCFYFFQPEQIADLTIEGDSVSISTEMDAMILMHGSIDAPKKVHLVPNGEKWFIYFINDHSDGFIETTMINDSFMQLIINIPEALVNSLFRPLPFDPGSWLKYPAMLETLALFAFVIFAFVKRKKLSSKEKGVLWSIAIFIICLSLIIGWVTPVLGAIVRYRVPTYIALLMIGLIIYEPKKARYE